MPFPWFICYDEAAAKEAATETVTANLVTYPVITFKLHCTGTLPDGTQVEELVRLDYYIDGMTAPGHRNTPIQGVFLFALGTPQGGVYPPLW